MAQRTFSSPLRISVIAEIFFIFLCGFISLQLAVAKSTTTKVIDNGGVRVPPTLPSDSRQKVAIRNRSFILNCPIELDASLDVKQFDRWWMKDGSKLDLHDHQSQNPNSNHYSNHGEQPNSSRIWLDEEGDLHFEKIVHKLSGSLLADPNRHRNYSDEGDYRCVVKSPTGVVLSPLVTLSVAAIEAIEVQEISVKVRDVALLECQIRSIPRLSSSNVSWFRGENLSLTQEYNSRYNILSSGTLLISNVQLSDSGIYKCVARNVELRRELSVEVKLIVSPQDTGISSEPPKFLPIPTSALGRDSLVVLDEEEVFVLECIATGLPQPSITWVLTYVDDNGTSISPLVKILSDGKISYDSVVLIVENSNPLGNYTCLASNGVGNPIRQTIQVARLPVLLKQPESFQLPPAKTVRFECKVQNPFSLIWYKDGQLLETGRGRVKTRGNEIVISNTIRNDSGFYQCEVIAEDRIYAIGTSRLLVENNREAPDAPVDLHCVQNNTRTITVAWRTVNKLDVKAFTVHYMPFGGEERQQVTPRQQNDNKLSNFTIESLKPHTNYSIYIRSYSGRSASAQSSRITCTTLEDVPITAIRNLIFEQHGPPTQTRIRWRPLNNGEARGKIVLYKLQWRPIDGEFANVRYIDGAAEEFLVTELTPGLPYEMRLIPSTSAGWPLNKDSFAWIPVPLTENSTNLNPNVSGEDYSAPLLHLTVLNSTSIQVNWSVSKEVSIKGFRLTFWTYTDTVGDVVSYGPFYIYDNAVHEYLFTDFAPSTSYEITVQSYGETWESDVASKTIKTFPTSNGYTPDTEENFPSVAGLQAHPISSEEVRLMWERPKFNNTQIPFYYTVKYNQVDESTAKKFIRSTRESVEIKELKPFTSYEFVVQVTGLSGLGGPYSQKVESRTHSGIPGQPTQLNWKVRNQTLIEVEWKPPILSNGIIDRYLVEYKTNISTESQDKNSIIGNAGTDSPMSSSEYSWKTKPTNSTMMYLENLTLNEYYAVRVKAETKAGIGQPSSIIFVRIFTRLPEPPPQNDGYPPGSEEGSLFSPHNPQHLGIILGVALGIVCIILCATIIMCRHRCFPLPRPEIGVYVNGNGHPPRSRRSLESLNCVEMKVLESLTSADQHLDTKGGHPHLNGIIPGPNNDGVADPLLMRIVRNPIDHQHDVDVDEEVVPNCIH